MFRKARYIAGIAGVAMAMTLGGVAQAKNGADDPPNHHHHHHGKKHHHHEHGANHG